VVVKFGGADLSTGNHVKKAAEMIKESDFEEIVVVVSAMGKTTDQLIGYLSEIGEIDDSNYSEIVAMGERISARVFSSTLKSVGVESTYFDPQQPRWPIITDSNFKNAKPLLAETRKRVKKNLEPLLGGCVPVVCGFLGKDMEEQTTLLGRGGSDITATLLGNCLKADYIILVKETEGVLSADPNVVPDAKPLSQLTVEEMFSLAHGGAKIIHPEALKYKLPTQRLRFVSFSSGFSETGTEITGVFKSNSMEITSHRGLTAFTLIGDINSENLSRLFSALGNKEIFGISTGGSSITVFARIEDSKRMSRKLHDLGCFKAVSSRGHVGIAKLLNPEFIDSPGWVAKISGSLADKGINILEITTSKASISVFVDEKRLDEALQVLSGL
jgi:aspartate kinase